MAKPKRGESKVKKEKAKEAETKDEQVPTATQSNTNKTMAKDTPDTTNTGTSASDKKYWWSRKKDLSQIVPSSYTCSVREFSAAQVEQLFEKGRILYQEEVQRYEQTKGDDFSEILRSGTSSDKIAAFTVLIQKSAFHRLRTLNSLIRHAQKKHRREAQQAIEALKDLFLNLYLPPTRLTHFRDQALKELKVVMDYQEKNKGNVKKGNYKRFDDDEEEGKEDVKSKWLSVNVEEILILWHFEHMLKTAYADFIDVMREWSQDNLDIVKHKVMSVTFQLLQKPEMDSSLVQLIVNKLGDSERKIASKAGFLALQISNLEPKSFWKNKVYEQFEALLSRPNLVDSAKYYALTYLNQLVFTREDKPLAKKLLQLYLAVFKEHIKEKQIGNRLMSALLTGVNRAYPFAGNDPSGFEVHIDDIFRMIQSSNFNIGIQALRFIFLLMHHDEKIADRFYKTFYEIVLHPQIRTTNKITLFMNLIFQALKGDVNDPRTAAIAKRLFQISLYHKPEFACAMLFLTSEVMRRRRILKALITQPEQSSAYKTVSKNGTKQQPKPVNDDEDEEVFRDVPEGQEGSQPAKNAEGKTEASADTSTEQAGAEEIILPAYDFTKRDPRYSNADRSALWELIALHKHFHPSAHAFSKSLLERQTIDYDGDPLVDFSLIAFLDKFSKQNAKKATPQKSTFARSVRRRADIDTLNFMEMPDSVMHADQEFYLKYNKAKSATKERAKNQEVDDFELDEESRPARAEEHQRRLEKLKKLREDDDERLPIEGEDDEGDEDVDLDGLEEDAVSDASSVYSYSELDRMDEDDLDDIDDIDDTELVDDDELEEILMENLSDTDLDEIPVHDEEDLEQVGDGAADDDKYGDEGLDSDDDDNWVMGNVDNTDEDEMDISALLAKKAAKKKNATGEDGSGDKKKRKRNKNTAPDAYDVTEGELETAALSNADEFDLLMEEDDDEENSSGKKKGKGKKADSNKNNNNNSSKGNKKKRAAPAAQKGGNKKANKRARK